MDNKFDKMPDDIMLKIITPLGMKSAAQTSIISKSWRYLWTYLTDLNFDPMTLMPAAGQEGGGLPEKLKYLDWINQVVSMHRGETIDRFQVMPRCGRLSITTDDFDKWVQFALSKKVKQLVLHLSATSAAYTLGFDFLARHPPCETGIAFVAHLHLTCISVSDEFMEFIFDRCCLLERLYLEDSNDIVNLKIRHCKLKYLTLIVCRNLKQLQLDVPNLVCLQYTDTILQDFPNMVFDSPPAALTEATFKGYCCRLPSPVFQPISSFSTQLSKLSFDLSWFMTLQAFDEYVPGLILYKLAVEGFLPTFPNVEILELSIKSMPSDCILPVIYFLRSCPVLRHFTLMVFWDCNEFGDEAKELLQVEESEDAIDNVEQADDNKPVEMNGNPEFEDKIENKEHEQEPQDDIAPNLSVFQVVGFRGCTADVRFALQIVDITPIQTIICNPRNSYFVENPYNDQPDFMDEILISRSRARKLAKIVQPKTKVVIL